MKQIKKLKYVIGLLFICNVCFAKIKLPSILSDNMVLQQKSEATIWGWTSMLDGVITVQGSWNNRVVKVRAVEGRWSVELPTPTAGGPYRVTIKGDETIVLKDVLIGEVWLCSGQSNMEFTPAWGMLGGKEAISKATDSSIRFFTVPRKLDTVAQMDVKATWKICSPETMKKFSAVGYFFGQNIKKRLQVPIGLIGCYWGGSSIEVWTKKELITADSTLVRGVGNLLTPSCCPQKQIGQVYNGMLHPIINFNIAGAIWYQGEANRNNTTYYKTLPLLINSWRKDWNKLFPFYIVQLAPFRYKKKEPYAPLVRDAQLQTISTVPNTGLVVTNDIGNLKNVHPKNKREVGRRLSLWALAKTYGVKNLVYSGPIYKTMELQKNKAILYFDSTGLGLVKKGKRLEEFYMAGKDKVFYPAKAYIKKNTVVVSCAKVKHPIAVRFAFSDTALPNLYNKEGLPASAFRTDHWSLVK
ncbi:MAG: sialate O-acetylesterase [Polaribacter sp.]